MPNTTKYTQGVAKDITNEVLEEVKAKGGKVTVTSIADEFISKAKDRGIEVEDARTKRAAADVNKKISDEVQKEMAAKGPKATENDFVNAHIRISKKYGVNVKDLRQKKAAYAISAKAMGFNPEAID